ncbi:MAG: hypothetical protein V7K60_30500 [Nostoc sp.]
MPIAHEDSRMKIKIFLICADTTPLAYSCKEASYAQRVADSLRRKGFILRDR